MKEYKCKHCASFRGCCDQRDPNADTCEEFFREPVITNGDRFRHMDDSELAAYFSIRCMCDFCPARREDCGDGGDIHECFTAWELFLDQEVTK
jgi:hypothetical protein